MKHTHIQWEPLRDRHLRGQSPVGDFWIRLGREDRIVGIYLIRPESSEKWVPCEEMSQSLEWAKLFAEDITEQTLFSNELAEKEKTKS